MWASASKAVELITPALAEKLVGKLLEFAKGKKDDMAISTLESLQSRISSLCAMTCDVDKQIKEAELCGHKKRKRQVEEWLEQVRIVLNDFRRLERDMETMGFVEKFFHSDGATKLAEKVHSLVEQHQHFGELVADDYDNKGYILAANGLVGEEFEKNLQGILRLLDDDKVSSIGIYGMGGVGKTTLAKHINNELLKCKQKSVFWTTVSQELATVTILQDEIAKFVCVDLSTERNLDIRAAILNKGISQRKNIIFIFDDVWEDIDMKKLGDPLSVEGCKLLITTRSEKVCNQFDCQKIKVEILKESEAWKLFNETYGTMGLSPEVQKIAKHMVTLCDGLPLGIITIAGSMKGEIDLDVWKDAWIELRDCVLDQSDMNEKVFKVLKYSFDRLERSKEKGNGYSRTQHCFLYCSLYPEDHRIKRDDLIRKWILEEYVNKRNPKAVSGRMHSTSSRKDLFCQGRAILDRLIKVCLLENVGVDHVKMHDLVRDMAHKITGGKTKVICGHSSLKEIPNEEHWSEDLEQMSLMENRISKIPAGMSPNCPRLSTLLFSGNPLRSIPVSFFKLMCSLCILDLSKTSIRRIPRSLSNLDGLKALLLEGCRSLQIVPDLGKLKKLRELDLSGTAVGEVPIKGVEIFYDLTYLNLDKCNKLKKLPEGLQWKFPNLQCIHLPEHIEASVQEMEQLEEFRKDVRDAFEFNSLIGMWRPSLTYLITVEPGVMRMKLFKCFEPCNLELNERRKMLFSMYDFGALKDTTLNAQDVQYLDLKRCKGRLRNGLVDLLPMLNNPTSIEYLLLCMCKELESGYMNEDISNGDAVMTSTSVYPPTPCALFSNLTVLTITYCERMKKLGIPASQLQNLQQLHIMECNMLEEIMDAVSEENGGGESGEASVVSLPKLKRLHLYDLPRLKSLCYALIICSSIEDIVLCGCQELKKLPLVFGDPNYDSPPSHLKRVKIFASEREWWEKLEMGHYTPTIRPMLDRVVRWWYDGETPD